MAAASARGAAQRVGRDGLRLVVRQSVRQVPNLACHANSLHRSGGRLPAVACSWRRPNEGRLMTDQRPSPASRCVADP
ncbi:MAG: hypothetical protein ABI351_12430 [Herbaspirillum sp.]